ncbi:hypothetical protein [Enterococcus gallinarum]|nr:hypothetical protein [Enterococcus gallinarum]
MIVLIITIISLIMIMKFAVVQHKLNFKRKKIIKEKFPELTKKDLKYRQIKIYNYQQLYLNSTFKHTLQMTSLVGTLIGVTAMLIVTLLSKNTLLVFLLASFTFGLISVFILTQPSLEERKRFWNDYLEEHPDNPLKFYFFPLELYVSAYENEKKLGVYYLTFAVSLLLVAILGRQFL